MAAGLICFLGGMIVLQTRRHAPGAVSLMVLMFALSWWDISYSLFWAKAPAPYPNFWLYVTYAGVVTVPAALVVFAMQVSEMDEWLRPLFIIGLCIEPILVLVLLFTDPWHGLYFAGKETQGIGMLLNGGPVHWANIVYSYLLILIGMVILIRRFIQSTGIYRKQLAVILIGAGIPWLNSIVFVLGLNPLPNVDNTPFSFTIAGFAFTYALLRFRLLDILPIARHALVESMSDGVIVLDVHNRLVDFNAAAERDIGLSRRPVIGESVERTFSAWPNIAKRFLMVNDIRVELPIGDPPRRVLDLKISPLYDHRKRLLGRLVVWRDITPLKKAQADLQEQAIRDHLTGLYNRRYLGETLERELARAKRGNHPVSLIMIDIDHFKNINDTFGHNMGDSILKSFAKQLLEQTRIEDIIYRYGGEEFLVLLPNVTSQNARDIAERWRTSFQEAHAFHEGEKIDVTLSCGIAEFPLSGKSSEELIAAADKSLYQAKAMGRNRVVIWQDTTR